MIHLWHTVPYLRSSTTGVTIHRSSNREASVHSVMRAVGAVVAQCLVTFGHIYMIF